MMEKPDYQKLIDTLREHYGLNFISVAFVQSAQLDYVLKWQYVSGNISNRYKRVVLRSGKGIAGLVFKSGKALYIDDVSVDIAKEDLFNYPIVISEELTNLAAFPIHENQSELVKGVILFGTRENNQIERENYNKIYQSFLNEYRQDGSSEVIL
ncbi:GAF domain-containing protein [Lederbergia panacisoli]|uniref:GAF domain-containing protein n=1 Tax=Lederbergia panacisoli TaxID=1255251 RepID=UPI00214C602A|nr:GAF domain-containing protein [Lederbergia panacisoli]MCR2821848.1 GAF domain-containing protein [Lederbergia panacisoli]